MAAGTVILTMAAHTVNLRIDGAVCTVAFAGKGDRSRLRLLSQFVELLFHLQYTVDNDIIIE